MFPRSRPLPAMLVLLGLVACENATEPPLAPPLPQFDHDPATEVTNLNDNGPGSLRELVFTAPSGSTIHFAAPLAGGTLVVNSPIPLSRTLTIEGPPQGITISGGGATTVFSVSSGGFNPVVTLRNLTITGADTGLPTTGHGTAIYVAGGSLNVFGSTIMGNAGAAVFHVDGSLMLQNSTISNNGGDGLDTSTGFGATLRHVTIAHNGGHGLRRAGTAVTLENTVIANNATDCSAGPGAQPNILGGVNLDSDDTCGLGGADLPGVDPLIEPLGNYGGPTPTHELTLASPAVDAAPCIVAIDQRGVTRPQGSTCDIGAYERIPVAAGLTIDPNGTVNPNTGAATVTGTLMCSRPLDVELRVDLSQAQMVRRVPVPKQSSATLTIPCNGPQVSWSATLQPPAGTAFVNGAATAAAEALNADDSGATQREVRLFWAKK